MSNEKTEKELIYELGYFVMELIFFKGDLNEMPFDVVRQLYDRFRTRASKLQINVPNLTEDVLNQQFFIDQKHFVENLINLNKTGAMFQLYLCGCHASLFFTNLSVSKTMNTRPTNALTHLQNLIEQARDLGEAIDDQLEEALQNIWDDYMNLKFDQDLNSIGLKLKNKVCGLGSEILNPSPTGYKRSEVDPTRIIIDECWAVSLVRLPERSNPEHAFIVLEGKSGRRSKIWFADFVTTEWFGSVEPGTGEGKVRMESFESRAVAGQTSDKPLLFKCERRMMDIRETDRWLYTTWAITKSTAENLIQNIKAQQQNPPRFHICGNRSVLAEGAARFTGNPTGHNCFTFAKKMLHDLNDSFIKLTKNDLSTWIMSATSGYLVDRHQTWYKKLSFPLMLLFALAVIVVAYFLFKTMNARDSLDNFICHILPSRPF